MARSTLRGWLSAPACPRAGCPRCEDDTLDHSDYAALLGYYLGDGCLSQAPRTVTLRVSCDALYPGIVRDVSALVRSVRPDSAVHLIRAPGCVVVASAWKHWPCLLPQHGPGKKHERPIILEPWQVEIATQHPADLLRGLFHSDGARVRNWATRLVAGERKRYDYPRWQFSNRSEDILDICSDALDLAGVAWRRSGRWTISVSRRADVSRLDELIGLKA